MTGLLFPGVQRAAFAQQRGQEQELHASSTAAVRTQPDAREEIGRSVALATPDECAPTSQQKAIGKINFRRSAAAPTAAERTGQQRRALDEAARQDACRRLHLAGPEDMQVRKSRR